jgi:hypothetical protein
MRRVRGAHAPRTTPRQPTSFGAARAPREVIPPSRRPARPARRLLRAVRRGVARGARGARAQSGLRAEPFSGLPPRVRAAAERLSAALSAADIPHAIAGAVACNAYGHRRATEDVDVLVNAETLPDVVGALGGAGWVPRYASAKRSWRDAAERVDVDVLLSGEFPGDGLPKPVAFPRVGGREGFSWARTACGARVLDLVALVAIKLASAASAPHRLKDAADVAALIEAQALPREFAVELDVSVRPLFVKLWDDVAGKRARGLA